MWRRGLDRAGQARAAALLARTATVAEEAGDGRVGLAALIALAEAESELARYRDARATLERAEALWRRHPDPSAAIDLWNAHAFRLTYQGEPMAAVEFRLRALEAARRLGDPARVRSLLITLGQNQVQLHDHAAAVESFREAIELEVEDSRRIITLASLGIAHFELNQLEQAEEALAEARRLAAAGGARRLEAWALGELGIVANKRDRDWDRALELLDHSIAMFAALGDARNEATFRLNRGGVLRDRGRHLEGLESSLEAEALLAAIEGQRPNPILTKNIADCLAGLGRLDEAEDRYRQAAAQGRELGDAKAHWQAHWGLARLYRLEGRADEVDAAFADAVEVIEGIRGALRLESFKADFFEDKVDVYAGYADFLVADSGREDRYRAAFEIAERARARALLDTLAESRASLHETLPPEILAAETELLDVIAEIQSRARIEAPSAERDRELEDAERRLEELYLEVRRDQPRFRELRYPRPAPAAAIQEALENGEVLLELLLAEPRSHLWVVSRDAIVWHELPARTEIDAAVRAAYGRLVDPSRPPQGLTELGRWLLGPLDGVLGAASTLVIVPSGILHYFPFEVLPWGESGAPLGSAVRTVYAPSATTLLELRRRDAVERPAAAPRLLAVGDPAYPAAGTAATAAGGGSPASAGGDAAVGVMGAPASPRLPHTRVEVERLASRFGRRRSTVLVGAEATEERLRREPLESFSLVHLATHGRIDAGHPQRSALVFADPPGGGEDGLLQMREIYRLPLAAELVTLSACRTAMGELVTGEGMVGLSRAFQYAGVRSIVASLWSVSDQASAEFMDRFYRHLARGEPKAEALRRARVELAATEGYGHPYYWAPYVLIGEGADPVRFPARGGAAGAPLLLGGVVAAMLAASGLLALRRHRARRRP